MTYHSSPAPATPTSRRCKETIVLPYVLQAQANGPNADREFMRMVGGDARTFRQAHEWSQIWAARLQQLGVEKGDRVAVLLPTSFASVELWSAITWLGAIEVPIHSELKGSMLAHVLNNSGAKLAVLADRYIDSLWKVCEDVPELTTVVVIGDQPATSPAQWHGTVINALDLSHERIVDGPGADYWDTAAIIYTSGTTGPAKGVTMPWGQMEAGLHGLFPDIGDDQCFYVPLPLHHIAGLGMVYRMAVRGGRVYLREKFSATEYWADIADGGCTATILMATMAEVLWKRDPSPEDSSTPLRTVLMSPQISNVAEFEKRFDVKVRTNFGMTEVGAPIVGGVREPLANGTTSGKVCEHFECRVVDANDEPVPVGEVGELVVRTALPWMITSGYWADDARTRSAMRNQWFHTGDGFRQDADGNFYFVDRMKDTIRRRGENISSFHLEAAVLEHPDIADCAVVGVASDMGEQEIHALVVPKHESHPGVRDLIEFLRERIAGFMIPRYWTFVDELPKTATHRVQKSSLRDEGLRADTIDATQLPAR